MRPAPRQTVDEKHPSRAAPCFGPCPGRHHPAILDLSDRSPNSAQSLRRSHPVRGALPLFQSRIRPPHCLVSKLKLLYIPVTWTAPLHFTGAWKVHRL